MYLNLGLSYLKKNQNTVNLILILKQLKFNCQTDKKNALTVIDQSKCLLSENI